jgi:hypothetical protein
VRAVHRVQEFDGHVEGHIYAQPLYWRAPVAGPSLVIAATESDLVFGLDADTGHVVWRTALGHPVRRSALPCGNIDPLGITGTPVIVAAGLATRGFRFDPAAQNQRGALALLNGRIYVSFGGHFGDCSDYHGVVVGVGIDPPRLIGAWLTRAAKGGIWAPAGLSEAGGFLYFSTGNTEGARNWGDGGPCSGSVPISRT